MDDPDFVVAESVSDWGALNIVNSFILNARLERFSFLVTNDTEEYTDEFHHLVKTIYDQNRADVESALIMDDD